MPDISNWEKVASIATAIGGVGAMISAFFSWRSAKSSKQSSVDARDALAASLKPQVQLDWGQSGPSEAVIARAYVVGPLSPAGVTGVQPASDVRLEVNSASGRRGENYVALLEPSSSMWGREPPHVEAVLATPTDDWPPTAGDHATATVTFSDLRGVGTYRLSRSVDLHPSDEHGPAVVSFRNLSELTEQRI